MAKDFGLACFGGVFLVAGFASSFVSGMTSLATESEEANLPFIGMWNARELLKADANAKLEKTSFILLFER